MFASVPAVRNPKLNSRLRVEIVHTGKRRVNRERRQTGQMGKVCLCITIIVMAYGFLLFSL